MNLAPLAPLPADLRPPAQTLAVVLCAELRRLVRQGGLVPALVASLLTGLVVGLGALPFAARIDAATARVGAPLALGVATAALVLAVGAALHSGAHTSRGGGPTTLALTPDRSRSYAARLTAVATVAGAHTGGVALLVGTTAAAAADTMAVAQVLLGAVAGALGGALLCVLAAVVGIMVDHPAGAALTLLGWWAVVPITASAVVGYLPRPLAWLAEALVTLSPPLLAHEMADPGATPGHTFVALAGMTLWAVPLGAFGLWLHGRRSLTRRRTSQAW